MLSGRTPSGLCPSWFSSRMTFGATSCPERQTLLCGAKLQVRKSDGRVMRQMQGANRDCNYIILLTVL